MATELTEKKLEPSREGSAGAFSFVLAWEQERSGTRSADVTWGSLQVIVANRHVWGSPGRGIRWAWIDLLEYLADVWAYLNLDEGFPPGLGPGDPQVRLRHLSDAFSLADEAGLRPGPLGVDLDRVQEFIEAHDLASGPKGISLPSIWLVRDGMECWICSTAVTVASPIESVLEGLTSLADLIADRLNSYAHDGDLGLPSMRGKQEMTFLCRTSSRLRVG